MESLIILCAMFAAGRCHGIGVDADVTNKLVLWFDQQTRWLSYVLVTLAYGYAAATFLGIYAAPLGLLSAVGLSLGHGRFYAMEGANTADPEPELIEKYWALPIFNRLGLKITTPAYSWFCMGSKGLIINTPNTVFSPAGAFLWPTLYAYSFKRFNTSAVAEYLTTGTAGILIILLINLNHLS